MPSLSAIRNFCIIAHIDHGKSTLADRLLEQTHTITEREFRDQILDDMDLERERGITIKSHPVTMAYTAEDGQTYELNLIDTPGHVDFSYEVTRSIAACEGALLVVDAAQGVEAQTVANANIAMARGLEIVPIINKIDLPNADVDAVASQLEELLAVEFDECICVSAKTGEGITEVLHAIVDRVPAPGEKAGGALRALVFDSVYDAYRGVVSYIRIVDGRMSTGERVRLMGTGNETEVKEVGTFCPKPTPSKSMGAGRVGYLVGTIKDPAAIRIGDTLTHAARPSAEPLPGFKEVRPMVFSGLYPVNGDDYEKFRQGLEKLSLNDSSITFHPETSVVLGFGFRCGFLGLLHMEVIQERLRREFDLDIISTHPAVVYKVRLRSGEIEEFDNPVRMPEPTKIDYVEEPVVIGFIICPNECIGEIMKLVMDRRGQVQKTESLDTRRVIMTCMMPLNEILTDFHDNLKSISKGYASLDYEHAGFRQADIVRLDILLNGEIIDAFSAMVERSKAAEKGRQICKALKEAIPQHMFSIPVQAALGGTVVARETIKAFRKDVTAKLYGGDVTRKMKLREKQKAGKRRMKQFGTVNVPQEAFVSVLKT